MYFCVMIDWPWSANIKFDCCLWNCGGRPELRTPVKQLNATRLEMNDETFWDWQLAQLIEFANRATLSWTLYLKTDVKLSNVVKVYCTLWHYWWSIIVCRQIVNMFYRCWTRKFGFWVNEVRLDVFSLDFSESFWSIL